STQNAASAASPIVPAATATQARPDLLRDAVGRGSPVADTRESHAGFDTGKMELAFEPSLGPSLSPERLDAGSAIPKRSRSSASSPIFFWRDAGVLARAFRI